MEGAQSLGRTTGEPCPRLGGEPGRSDQGSEGRSRSIGEHVGHAVLVLPSVVDDRESGERQAGEQRVVARQGGRASPVEAREAAHGHRAGVVAPARRTVTQPHPIRSGPSASMPTRAEPVRLGSS